MQDKILIVEDDQMMRETCKQILNDAGYFVKEAANPNDASGLIIKESFDLVITDLRMPYGGGKEVIRNVRNISNQIPVILITAYPSVDSVIDAFKNGVIDYLVKPFTTEQLINSVESIFEKVHDIDHSNILGKNAISDNYLPEIIGKSPAINNLIINIRRIAPLEINVLINGETGSGKELVAKAIHKFSGRAHYPFITINCAAIPDNLIESELFGYEKGSFTDAKNSKAGLIEQANNGTLFFDEIGDLSPSAQAKLLRILEEGECRRIGSVKTYKTNVRIVSATNKNLPDEIKKEKFRRDLFYRISALEISTPPLRERMEDIPVLSVHFLKQLSAKHLQKEIVGFSKDAFNLLKTYSWPGNVRELQNVVQKSYAYATGPLITPEEIKETQILNNRTFAFHSSERDITLDNFEKEYLENTLKQNNFNISNSAKLIGIHRSTLQRRIKQLGITINSNPI